MLHPPHYISLLIIVLLGTSTKSSGNVFTWKDADRTFNTYCYECHGGFATDGGLDLINIDQKADLKANPERWMKVLQALRTHYMPHPDGQEMPETPRNQLIEKIHNELIKQSVNYDPISAPLRRLNRIEFSNTVNDLFLVDEDWTQFLPADDAGYGFDNIAAALSFSPLLLERYFDTADRIATIAVPQKLPNEERILPAIDFSGGNLSKQTRKINSSNNKNTARNHIFFPGKGSYRMEVQLSAEQAGPDNARAELWFNGVRLSEHEVIANKGDLPDVLQQTIEISNPGEYEIEIRFSNDFFVKTDSITEDRNLIFHQIKLTGPRQSASDLQSPFLDRHFGSLPETLSIKELRDGIHRFASRAYRRPVTHEEVTELWKAFQANTKTHKQKWDVRNGLYAVIDAILTSPTFLFRFEGKSNDANLDSFALASWLSYFLWSSMPDDSLFELAQKGRLHIELEGEINRMLADPKAIALTENFAGQWWGFRDLEIHNPDRSIYKDANKEFLSAMRKETEHFFTYIVQNDRSLLDFLTADYSFINEPLAKHYGIEGVTGMDFQKVSLTQTLRRGIWTHAGILTVTSYPNYTSPVLRGQWILENLIGLSPPPPPDNIPSLPGTNGNPNSQDLRANLKLHRENSDCASCHDIMDPIGLTLEHFDAIGGLRSIADRKQLSNETLFDGTVIKDPIDFAHYLKDQRSHDFVKNLAHKLSIYASGRGLDWRDKAALHRITESISLQNFRFSALIHAVVKEFAPTVKSVSLTQVQSTQ